MLPDKFFFWPYETNSLDKAIADLRPLLEKSGLKPYLNHSGGDLAEFCALVCRNWNINPAWLLVSAQREQSVLGNEKLLDKAVAAWLGVVGQDVGRTDNPGFYGVYTQVERFCEVSAWLLGKEPATKWPEYLRTRKTSPRFRPGLRLTIERDGKAFDYLPLSAGEFCQLAYTPHWHVLQTNEVLARRWVPSKL